MIGSRTSEKLVFPRNTSSIELLLHFVCQKEIDGPDDHVFWIIPANDEKFGDLKIE